MTLLRLWSQQDCWWGDQNHLPLLCTAQNGVQWYSIIHWDWKRNFHNTHPDLCVPVNTDNIRSNGSSNTNVLWLSVQGQLHPSCPSHSQMPSNQFNSWDQYCMQFITVSLPPPGLDEAPDDWITKCQLDKNGTTNMQKIMTKSVLGKTATSSQENSNIRWQGPSPKRH